VLLNALHKRVILFDYSPFSVTDRGHRERMIVYLAGFSQPHLIL
jgi:hypothetical protein